MSNVEAMLVAWLAEATGVEAFADVPSSRPSEFITVERTGGSQSYGIDRATVAVQCWSTSRAKACELALKVDGAIPSFADEQGVFSVERSSLYNFPDERGNVARYQLMVNITTA